MKSRNSVSPATTISTFEFMEMFPDDDAAREHFERVRWSGSIDCPCCGTKDKSTPDKRRPGYRRCRDCRHYFTVRTGTVFERSHIELRKWLYAMYLLETSRKGISSLQLSKEIGITQKSAWFLLHRLRTACDVHGLKLRGFVEIDETYMGGKQRNRHDSKPRHRTGGSSKQAVLGMRERGGRTIAKPVSSTDRATLQGEIGRAVASGATIYTDEHASYDRLNTAYTHATVCHSAKEYVNGMVHTNGIESVWAVLKRGYSGVYHNWSMKHMAQYLNEFTFRLNEGNCKRDTIARMNDLCRQAVGKRLTYQQLITQ